MSGTGLTPSSPVRDDLWRLEGRVEFEVSEEWLKQQRVAHLN